MTTVIIQNFVTVVSIKTSHIFNFVKGEFSMKFSIYVFSIFSFLAVSSCTSTYNSTYTNLISDSEKCSKNCSEASTDALRIRCYTMAIVQSPNQCYNYFKRGKLYQKNYLFTSAIIDFEEVIRRDPANMSAYFSLISIFTLINRKEVALNWLEKAFEAGFDDYRQISEDSSLENLRQTERFKLIVKKWEHRLLSSR